MSRKVPKRLMIDFQKAVQSRTKMQEDRHSFESYRICGMTGALSLPHVDAEGSISYTEVRNGQKLWWLQDPLDEYHYNLQILNAGDVITMPPERSHAVYTINAFICAGGHAYSGDPMILKRTRHARRRGQQIADTNQHVPVSLAMLQDLGIALTHRIYLNEIGLEVEDPQQCELRSMTT